MTVAGPGPAPAALRGGAAAAPAISAVVPALNESESLPELHRQLVAALEASGRSWEIVYVDDGSRDGTDRVMAELAAGDPRVGAIVLRRNFGKSAALATGFREARGELVLTLDADLQDDPAELARLVAALEQNGLDLVSGWKQTRHDPISKTVPSKLFNAVTSAVAGVRLHDFNCGLKLYRREVVEAIEVYGELHRFMPALAHWRGFRVGEIPVNHRPRLHGKSKFGASRFVNGFLDLLAAAFISTQALKPLHVFGRIGILFLAVGALPMGLFLVQWLQGEPLRVRPLMLLGVGMIIVGIVFILMGLLGAMIAHLGARVEYPVRRRHGRDLGGPPA
jgi:glycosyltransferase involved in cell wall biosynthesis